MKWIVGSDHAGFDLKQELVQLLKEWGDEVLDLGPQNKDSVDYPDYGGRVAKRVAGEGGLGLLVCGTGNGIMMAANKVAGIRCALVTNEFSAIMARAHNDANIISIGARITGGGVAAASLKAFRGTTFEGGRHKRRVDKIMDLEGA